ncbi:MAG: dUTP diphosphatase [Candidatus Pacebacteria bacterium CG_4_10_14_0_8_um_filter_43_12]|nr:MAG: dUTP diphosphatase [Candidatus Pacebacteria bacterium CG10_big_fil_rev_8_21_14_0_10_44_11]PIY79108.1 MAG: dUTP diphosphatase [Candidatus Pacebacteria bacterium CG_4_10_14_0_8_um_filter_43_12]
MIRVKLKLFDASLPVPEYKTDGAAAMDLCARVEVTVPARSVGLIPLNIALQLPKDHWVLLAARSSLHKKGLMMANGIGVGDYDYCGDGDEYHAAVFNFSDKKVIVEKGERIVQMIVMQRERVELEEVEKFKTKDRGGFGSTGSK